MPEQLPDTLIEKINQTHMATPESILTAPAVQAVYQNFLANPGGDGGVALRLISLGLLKVDEFSRSAE